MSHFVDIETSPEAIQEDEELIEAVEAAVEIVTESIYNQIRYEIVTFLEQVQQTVEAVFPILADYRQKPELIWPDLEHLAIFLVLYIIAFFFLAPSTQRRGNQKHPDHYLSRTSVRHTRSRSGSFAESWSYDEVDNAANSLNSVTGARYLAMMQQHEEESDEERFARVYPSLFAESHYDRLILPPVCRRIEKPKASELRQQKEAAEKAQQRKKKAEQKARQKRTDEADDPVERLQKYYGHFLVLVRSLFTFDYAGAAWTILLWLQGIIKHRRIQRRDRLVKSPQRIASTGTDDDNLSQGDDSSQEEGDEDDNDDDSEKSGTDEGENDSMDSVNLPQHHNEGQLNDNESENNTADTAASTAPSTPFATPKAGNCPTNVITTSQINSQTPRVPTLHSLTVKNSILSPLIEEKKETTSISDGGKSDDLYNVIPPKPSPFLLQPKHSSGRKVKQSAVEEDDDADFEVLPQQKSENIPAMPAQSNLESPRASGNTVYHSSRQVNGDSGAHSHSELNKTNDQTQLLYEQFSLPGTISTPRASGSRQQTDDPRTPTRPADGSKARSSTWYFFETAQSKESLKQMSVDVPVPDKNGYFVGDEFLPDDRCTPLLVFVNSRSGPQQGHLLITQLKRLLNPIQIWDLANGPPESILESFLVFTKLRILVCGGDGTVSWIISALDSMDLKQRKWPPIAILPLGTGNDLARIHGWGAGYNNESLIGILEQISDSYVSILDRWELTIMTGGSKKKVKATKNFFNYFSVGVDAEAALQVHYLRERRPEWFFSRLVNKAWYGVLSAEESIKGNSVNVRREIVLYADGVRVPLPQDSQGIIILNIDSYAGGVPLWSYGVKSGSRNRVRVRRSQSLSGMGNIRLGRGPGLERTDSTDDLSSLTMSDEERFAKVTACDRQSSCQDGYLDIVSVRGLVHLGQCKVGIGSAHRLAQCREIKIVIKKKVAVQIDGEPWRQDKCVLHIKRKPEPAIMLHRSADDGGIETEMSQLLDWAEERRLIDGQVHGALMKEFSRRIESKTRERRHEKNVLQNLKRAIGSTSAISSMNNPSRKNSLSPGISSRPYLRESPGMDDARRRSKSLHNLVVANNSFPGFHHDSISGINF